MAIAMHLAVAYSLVLLGSYLIGSIPFSWIVTKLKIGEDLRKIGSGNVGGRNVYRATKSRNLAILAGILDLTRSITAIATSYFIFRYFFAQGNPIQFWPYTDVIPSSFALTIAGLGAAFGHNWPVYLLSHGGRGITVVLGSLLVANPILIAFWVILWPIIITIVGYSSITYVLVTALVGVIALFLPPGMMMPWAKGNLAVACLMFGIALIMLSRQKDNFRKIRSGEAKKMRIIKALKGKKKLSDEILK